MSGESLSEFSELDRDLFLRQMLRDLTGTLEDVIGLETANGFLALTGQRIAEIALPQARARMSESRSTDALGEVLCDFKAKIQGDFYVIAAEEERLILGNRVCPFGAHVQGRPSLCMMTSNVFGTIAADSFGYAQIVLEETIANGDPQCRVVVGLSRTSVEKSGSVREYFK